VLPPGPPSAIPPLSPPWSEILLPCYFYLYLVPTGGYTTRTPVTDQNGLSTGAKSKSDCVAPPGYRLDTASSALVLCANGTYASGFGRRTTCTSCGTDIYSQEQTATEHPDSGEAGTNALIRGASTDCCEYYSAVRPQLDLMALLSTIQHSTHYVPWFDKRGTAINQELPFPLLRTV
jgi:hypothetical protein